MKRLQLDAALSDAQSTHTGLISGIAGEDGRQHPDLPPSILEPAFTGSVGADRSGVSAAQLGVLRVSASW